jgi:hypothetical protein
MAPETASTTDVCPYRASHGALVVRLVQVTPAAKRATPADGTHAKAHARPPARRGPSYKYRTSPPCNDSARTAPRHKSARTAPRRSHAANRRVREDAIRWKHNHMCAHKGKCARTHAPAPRAHAHQCTHSNPYTSIDAATHSRSHAVAHAHRPAYTQTLTHKHMLQTHTDACTHTHTHERTHTNARTCTRTHTCREACLRCAKNRYPAGTPCALSRVPV